MSVSASVNLPDQPAAGALEVVPLGGNGFTAPQLAYAITISLASDAGGGTNTLTVVMDPQFTFGISYVQTLVTSSAADVPSRRTISLTANETIQDAEDAEEGEGTTAVRLWKPPGVLGTETPLFAPTIVSRIANTDTETHFLSCRIYCFNKRAREKTPLWQLLQNFPR